MKDLKTLKNMLNQLFFVLNKKQRMKMIGMFFVIFVGSIFELLGVSAMLPFVQAILTPEILKQKPYIRAVCDTVGIHSDQSVVILVGIGIVIIYLVKNLYLALSIYLQAIYSNRTRKELSILMLHSFINRPYSFFIDQGMGVISEGVYTDTQGVQTVIATLFSFVSESLVILSVAIYLVLTDWIMAIGVLIVAFFCMLIIILGLKKKISSMSSVYRDHMAIQWKWFYQIVGGIKDILIYGRQTFFMQKFEDSYEKSSKSSAVYTFISGLPERVIEAFCIVGIIVTVLVRLSMGIDARTFVPSMAAFAMGAFRLLPSISRTTGYINTLVFNRKFLENTYNNISESFAFQRDVEEYTKGLQEENNTSDVELEFRDSIDIRNLTWKYEEGKQNVLSNLCLTIRKGQAIGIIGESGSGKSTFSDILLRLYHPQKGEILMDGINIDAIPKSWSKVIGYVPQTVFLVDDTVRENIVFGADEYNEKRVWNALKQASLDEFIKGLPNGLDTVVGERGVKFSGGQRQRVAIARALYDDPQILILDEATSALDNETEMAVMEAIDALAGHMTLVIIAHRVTTLKRCDKIYEIVDGKAIERNKKDILNIQ